MAGATLTFYGGLRTIGGTKAVVAEDGYRVIFDFGAAYAPGAPGSPFDHRLRPRPGAAGLRDLLAAGVAPPLPGLYAPEAAAAAGLPGGGDGRTAVVISHLHLDHMNNLDLLAPDVPVHMSAASADLHRALVRVGQREGAGCRVVPWQEGEVIEVGPLRVRPLPVDHDIPGACALLIETGSGAVVYSGDLRLHGARPELTRTFAATAAATRPALLLLEGTRLHNPAPQPGDPSPLSEPEVALRVAELVATRSGLAVLCAYPRHVERLAALAGAVRAAGRTLLLQPETAHILQACTGSLHGCGIYAGAALRAALAGGPAPQWLAPLLPGALDAAAVRAAQDAFVLDLPYGHLTELVDLAPAAGSLFLHSGGEPLGQYDPAWSTLQHWLGRLGVEYAAVQCTGHAAPEALTWIAAEVAPRVLMPIHSLAPEKLAAPGVPRLLPELHVPYDIATVTGDG